MIFFMVLILHYFFYISKNCKPLIKIGNFTTQPFLQGKVNITNNNNILSKNKIYPKKQFILTNPVKPGDSTFKVINLLITIIIICCLSLGFKYIIFNINKNLFNLDLICTLMPNGEASDSVSQAPSDPKSWWPTGVPQGLAPIGAALLTYRTLGNTFNPRLRVLASLGALGVSGTGILFHSILQQPVGFNRFCWGYSVFRETGTWPSLEQANQTTADKYVKNVLDKAQKDPDVMKTVADQVSEARSKSNFMGDDFNILEIITKIINKFMESFYWIFKPAELHGTLGDLIGQQFVIYILLFIIVISIILLFISYLLNIILILNKDKILNNFKNKYIIYYIKYQTILIKFSLVYIPIFIFAGLITLAIGLHFLITHQIPYEKLGINLESTIEILLSNNKRQ